MQHKLILISALLFVLTHSQLEARDNSDMPPLHVAVRDGKIETVKLLLSKGAKINARTTEGGTTPLHVAVLNAREEIVELLLSKRADTTVKNSDGEVPLQVAVHEKQDGIIRVFKTHGFDTDPRWTEPDTTAKAIHANSIYIVNDQKSESSLLMGSIQFTFASTTKASSYPINPCVFVFRAISQTDKAYAQKNAIEPGNAYLKKDASTWTLLGPVELAKSNRELAKEFGAGTSNKLYMNSGAWKDIAPITKESKEFGAKPKQSESYLDLTPDKYK